jgi:histidinol-phosphate aminotransferase
LSNETLVPIDHDEKNLLRMHLNENIVFPKNVMRSILAKCTDEYDPRIYPPAIDEGQSLVLNQEIAKYCGCSSGSVAIGVGGDQLIDLVLRMKIRNPSDNLLMVSPTFSMYPFFARRQGIKYTELWLNPSTSKAPFSLPLSKVKNAWKETKYRLLVLVSPNNPTGIQYAAEDIEEILETAPEKTVLLDEAYLEYAGYDASKRFLKTHPNLVVLRTFSKAFGLASLRLGYLLSSNSEFIREFNENYQYPYPVTGLSISMAIELLHRKELVLEWARKTKEFRDELIASVQNLGRPLRVLPRSDTNFVLVQAPNAKKIAAELVSTYAISVKYLPDLGKEKEFLRITVGPREANRRLLYALRRIIR